MHLAAASIMVVMVAAMLIVPVSSAASVNVRLNPARNLADVDAYINSTVAIKVPRSDQYLSSLLAGISSIMDGNTTLRASYSSADPSFTVLNNTIASKDAGARLESFNAIYSNTIENMSSAAAETLYANSSLLLEFTLSGIFSNRTANMSWRAMDISGGITIQSNEVGVVDVNGTMVSLVNFTAFQVSLAKWSRVYDSSANTTTFTFNAGTIQNYTWSSNSRTVNLSLKIDPSFEISTPGYAVASNNSIYLEAPPVHDTAIYYAIAVVFITGALASFYLSRRRR